MKIAIIEDEIAAARRLKAMIQDLDPSVEIVAELDSIEGSLNWLQQNPSPDLFFLDIQLADGSSFEIFNHTEIEKPVIFTTAYNQYAVQAFKVNAVDYLLKPIKRKELQEALNKYRKYYKSSQIDYKQLAEVLQSPKQLQRFLIRIGQSLRTVEIKEAAYFYTENKICFLVTLAGKRHPIEYSMEKLEEMLDPLSFFRINRQFIISIKSIKDMIAYSKSRVKLELAPPYNSDIIVSTERSGKFKKWLAGEIV